MVMADKKNNGDYGLGEISTIRNILMGEHISQFQESFKELEIKLEASQKQISDKIANVEKDYSERLAEIKKNYEEKIASLERELEEKSQALEAKITSVSSGDKNRLAALFANLSEEIIKH